MPRQSTRIKRERIDPTMVVANEIDMPQAQRVRADLVLVDVVNHSDGDQRSMLRQRAGEDRRSNKARQTVRKLTKIEKLERAGIIGSREALACEAYQAAYENHYETRVKIADWSATGGGGDRAYGHWPHGTWLEPGQNQFEFMRQAIPPSVRPMFERVVLHGHPLGKLAITFRSAAQRLLAHVEGKVAL